MLDVQRHDAILEMRLARPPVNALSYGAYRELAAALLKHWKSGKALPTFTPES